MNAAAAGVCVCACKAQRGSGPGAIKQKVPPVTRSMSEEENNLTLKVLCPGSWRGVIGQSDLQPQGL